MSDQVYQQTTTIIVRTQKEGIHCYPKAPSEVEFLRFPHRHMFHIEAELTVFHDDRELEFILVKRDLDKWLSGVYNLNYKSCEMIANDIIDHLVSRWTNIGEPPRFIRVDVFEDGENGARVIRKPYHD